jgi:hypothetical protein
LECGEDRRFTFDLIWIVTTGGLAHSKKKLKAAILAALQIRALRRLRVRA